MGTSLEYRRRVCADESLWARVDQALKEDGKKGVVADIVALLVAASPVVGVDGREDSKVLGPAISDEEIVACVAALP